MYILRNKPVLLKHKYKNCVLIFIYTENKPVLLKHNYKNVVLLCIY